MIDILVTERNARDGMPEGIYSRAGGSAANVAAWATACGYPSAWVGVVGDDIAGDVLIQDLKACGVVPYGARLPASESGIVISWLGRTRDRTMHSARAAASRLQSEFLPLDVFEQATAVHVTGYSMTSPEGFQATQRALSIGRRKGALLSLDPSDPSIIRSVGVERIHELVTDLQVDVIFANRCEATALTGCKRPRLAAAILGRLVRYAIVKDSARGCYLYCSGRCLYIPAVPAPVVDTTGAGDAFAGAWLANYLTSYDAPTACRIAATRASHAIGWIGARPRADVTGR